MDEYKLSKEAIITLEKFLDGSLDGTIKAEIRKRALIGGLCMAIPLWGIETVVYAIALWSTYSIISKISTVPFKDHFVKNVLGGAVVNLIVVFILGLALDFLPVFGWIGSFAVGYISILVSGLGYVKMLKAMHGNRAIVDVNFKGGMAALKENNQAPPLSPANSLIDKVDQFKESPQDVEVPSVDHGDANVPKAIDDGADFEEKMQHLKDLKGLLDAGVLTSDEYNEQKKILLNS